jgi:hypothetical protein
VSFILGVELAEERFNSLRADFDVFLQGLFAPKWPLPVGKFQQAVMARQRMAVVFAEVFREFLPKYRAGTAPKVGDRTLQAEQSLHY